MPQLRDSYGRTIGDLRISVTDRCNFRCTYCIPSEAVQWKPKSEILSFEEIVRLTRVLVREGVHKIRVTGGEPLLRPGVVTLVEQLASLDRVTDLALTTNGRHLAEFAPALKAAGLHRLNVSLDSLNARRFHEMTRRNALGEVLEGIEAAGRAGFFPVKVNAVIIRGVNDDEVVDFARFAAETGHTVRFIEFMPLDSGHTWSRDQVVPGREIIERIGAEMPLVRLPARTDSETSRRYRFVDSPGEIGAITPVTDPFCGNCNRLRLTADGQLRTCLFSMAEHDLKTPMRAGATDEELRELIAIAVLGKEAGHRINQADFQQPERTMSRIGG